jgi:phosphatidylglycerol:prolipoprotein diacylglycerol transferase
MFPVLIDLGRWDLPLLGETPIFLPTYGVLFALSVVVAWVWFVRRARTLGLEGEVVFNLVFYTVLAAILGAKLLLVVVEWRVYLADPALILGTLRSAGVLVGGVIAGAVTFALYGKKHGLPIFKLGDAAAAPLAFAQGLGRLGCLAGGCCWGRPTHADNPLAVTFTDPVASAQTGVPLNTPLIATQPLQLVADMALSLVLTVLWRRRRLPEGSVFWIYVLLYSMSRGTIELWRGDAGRGLYFDDLLSTSQLFAIAGVVFALVMLIRGRSTRPSHA